jgi:hypothetical protein
MPEGNPVGVLTGVADGERISVGTAVADGDGETAAVGGALGVGLGWAGPPHPATINRPAAAIATTTIALTAITTDLWPVQIRSITVRVSIGRIGSQHSQDRAA